MTLLSVNSLAMSDAFKARLPPLFARMGKMRHVVSGIKLHSKCTAAVLPMSWGTDTYAMWSCRIDDAWKATHAPKNAAETTGAGAGAVPLQRRRPDHEL